MKMRVAINQTQVILISGPCELMDFEVFPLFQFQMTGTFTQIPF